MPTRFSGAGGDAFDFFPIPFLSLALCLVVSAEVANGVMGIMYGKNLDFLFLVAGAMGSFFSSGHPFSGVTLYGSSQAFAGYKGFLLGSAPGSAPGGEGGGVRREAGGSGIGGGVIGPSGGLEGGAIMLFTGTTSVDGATVGKNCGRRWELDDVVSVIERACVFEAVPTLT